MGYLLPNIQRTSMSFLRSIIAGEKKVNLKSASPIVFLYNDVRMIPVPKYSELSIAKLWPNIKEVPELNIYFPDLKENELPERKYTWSVISTLKPDVVKKVVIRGTTSKMHQQQR